MERIARGSNTPYASTRLDRAMRRSIRTTASRLSWVAGIFDALSWIGLVPVFLVAAVVSKIIAVIRRILRLESAATAGGRKRSELH